MEEKDNVIIGRNAVLEALKSGRAIDTVLIAAGERSGSIVAVRNECRQRGIPVKETDPRRLDSLCGRGAHQGVAAFAAVKEYAAVEDLFALAESRGEKPLLVVCDGLEDARNLGAILRTAEAAGVHGVVVPKRHSASLSYDVGKASAGAVEYIPVARVPNTAAFIEDIKRKGVWVFGAETGGEPWCGADFTGPAAIVVGSEGKGLGRLVREKCDFIVSLPMKGSINSLNASVAAGIILFEAARQRAGIKAFEK